MTSLKIEQKIAGFRVNMAENMPVAAALAPPAAVAAPAAPVVSMSEKIERPEVLIGSTYKMKTPTSDHAMYITINDVILNEGTPHEQHDRADQIRRDGPGTRRAHCREASAVRSATSIKSFSLRWMSR